MFEEAEEHVDIDFSIHVDILKSSGFYFRLTPSSPFPY